MSILEAPVSARCSACGGPRCEHEAVLGRLLGCADAGLCLDCISFAFGLEPDRLAHGAVLHLRKKSCLWLAFDRERGCGCRLDRVRSAS